VGERRERVVIPHLPGVSDLFGWVVDSASSSIFGGIVSWMARGLAVLIEWIWTTLDTATTPRLTEAWFTTELMGPISVLALGVVVALMLASAIQAALAGRPEQILDAFKQAAWSLVATAMSITVIDLMLGVVDQASAGIWSTVRPDLQRLLENVISVMSASAVLDMGFLAALMMLLLYLALIGLAVALAMRNALIYVTALLAPLVFASSVLPTFRDSSRKIVHLGVALVVSKLAIVATLALAVKMMANATNLTATGDSLQDGVASLGVLFAGIVCFAVASFTPMVLYKLMPTVEGAMVGAGVASGWGRSAMTGMYAASSAKNLSGGLAKLASAPVPGTSSDAAESGGSNAADMPLSGSGPEAGAGAADAGSAASGSGAAGAGAGTGAAPVMVATQVADTVTGAGEQVGHAAEATLDAAASRHPSARAGAESTPPGGPPGAGSGSGDSPASDRVADLEDR
jgi:hypothetical protein